MTYTTAFDCCAPRRRIHARMRGFSLVELMVGMAIGLVLIAGLSLLFANTSQSGNELEKSIRQIENGRYATELLHNDFMLAGFYGEVPADNLKASGPADPCATNIAELGWDETPSPPKAPLPIMGFSDSEASALSCLSERKLQPKAPAVAIRRLDTDPVALASITSTDVAYVQTSRCNADPATSPFLIQTDAAKLELKNRQCSASNEARKYISRIYFIASCNECSGTGADTTPTLKMLELRGNEMKEIPLVEGVENMVLEYGFDTNAKNGVPGSYRTALSGTAGASDNDWANVVAVRMHLLVQTTEKSRGYSDSGKKYYGGSTEFKTTNDGFKRRVYSSTVRLTNIAGQREVPPPVTPPAS